MPKKPYPPFILLAGLVLIAITAFLDWPELLLFGFGDTYMLGGIAVMLLGMMAGVSVSRQFRAYETSIVPDHQPATLIKDGLFAYSRNPIYLSMVFILIGATILSGNGVGLSIAAGFAIWINWRWIPLEEENMRAQFGAEFEDYCQCVRRWI